MSYPDLNAVHDGFVTVLTAAEVRVREYEPNSGLNPPEVLIQAGEPSPLTMTIDGVHQTSFDLIVVVGANTEPRSQQRVLGTIVKTIRDALFGSTLNGAAQGVALDSFSPDDEIRFRDDDVNGWFGGFQRVRVMT